jgi:hypothetical protein
MKLGLISLAIALAGCAQAQDTGDDVPVPVQHDAAPTSDAPATMTDDSGSTVSDSGSPDSGDPMQVMPEAGDAGQPSPKIIFISSALYDGNLGGLGGADAKCQALATAASLPGMFKAWLSDSIVFAGQRLAHSKAPYVLVDKTVVANDWFGLTSGTLLHAINLTETGGPPPTGTYGCGNTTQTVWSHTNTQGSAASGGTCSDWTSTSATTTHAGSYLYKSWAWTDFCQLSGAGMCSKTAALYCIEQ